MGAIAPARSLWPLADPHVEPGQPSDHAPFGLSLFRPTTSPTTVVDIDGHRLDPATQTLVDRSGVPAAATTQSVTTNDKTTYDHSSWNDSRQDTYPD